LLATQYYMNLYSHWQCNREYNTIQYNV